MENENSETEKNLLNAFAGESQANRKYLAFSKKAEEQGFKQVAKLFRAAAQAETIHALNHLKTLGQIKDTKENLKVAIQGETHEFQEMYPEMIKQAKQDNNSEALTSFSYANQVEKIHAELYKKALQQIESGSDLEQKQIQVCTVCGNTFYGDVPDVCPICGAPQNKFENIN
jgi:rubrerythrin